MTVDPLALANLDVVLARFIAPHLRAFRAAATDTYPDDLANLSEWHAELDRMADAFERILTDDVYPGPFAYNEAHQADLLLFAKRLGYLWF
jgi:hypothetical protein